MFGRRERLDVGCSTVVSMQKDDEEGLGFKGSGLGYQGCGFGMRERLDVVYSTVVPLQEDDEHTYIYIIATYRCSTGEWGA